LLDAPKRRYRASAATHILPDTISRPAKKPKLWYVIQCNINCEKKAEFGLSEKGFVTYLPVLTKTVTHGRKKVERAVTRPLFARYLFVASHEREMPFYHLRSTNGVESIVRNDGIPLTVPADVVEDIMRREQTGEFDTTRQPKTLEEVGLTAGQEMQIIRGPFEGVSATVRKLMPGRNAEILIRLFGGEQAVRMPLAELRPVA
jgi:transcription antitermination factor NusG